MSYLLMFGAQTFGADLLADYLRRHPMIDDQYFVESPWYQEILRRGRIAGEMKIVRRALEGRFGMLSEDLVVALKAADEQTLEDIITHITTDTLEQVRARLGLS